MSDKTVRIHRFRDELGLSFLGIDGKTIYLRTVEAQCLGMALLEGARDINTTEFSASNYLPDDILLTSNKNNY